MKHIINYKLFEGLSHLITDDLYYEFSSVEQFDEIVNTEVREKISESEINTINRLVYKYTSNYGYNYGDRFEIHHNMSPSSSWLEIGHRQKPNHLIVKVFKLHDSYWAVEIELGSNNSKHQRQFKKFVFKWYICDDLEGLELLFKEIGIPN